MSSSVGAREEGSLVDIFCYVSLCFACDVGRAGTVMNGTCQLV